MIWIYRVMCLFSSVIILGNLNLSLPKAVSQGDDVQGEMPDNGVTDSINEGSEPSASKNLGVLEVAIEGITANYAQFETIKARWVRVTVNHDIKETKEQIIALADGGRMRFVETPASSDRYFFTSHGNTYRSKQYRIADESSQLTVVFRRDGDKVTEYYPDTNRELTRSISNAPVTIMDPREFGGINSQCGLISALRRSSLVETKSIGTIVEVTTNLYTSAQKEMSTGHRQKYEFDSMKNHLPIRIISYRENELVNSVVDLRYEELLPGAWFMREVIWNYAGSNKITEVNEQTRWTQTIRAYSVGKPEVNIPIADEDLAVRP